MPAKIKTEGSKPAGCLLIELSQKGFRVSNLGEGKLETGDAVTVVTKCGKALAGTIRWAHDGLAGVSLQPPLHLPEMSEIITKNRGDHASNEGELRYA